MKSLGLWKRWNKSYLPVGRLGQNRGQMAQLSLSNSQATAGFSMVELAIVVLVIGILSAIAAPGWLAFTNRQRTRTVNGAVLQALKSAQSKARADKEKITFKFNTTEDPPKIEITGKADIDLKFNGTIKEDMIAIAFGKCTDDSCTAFDTATPVTEITFNNLGVVDDENDLPFAVTTAIETGKGARRCVIVQTILGSMITGEDDSCPTPADW